MTEPKDIAQVLDLMIRPCFLSVDHRITQLNQAARGLLLSENMDVLPMIAAGQEAYPAPEGGGSCLTLDIAGCRMGAVVTPFRDGQLFLLDAPEDQAQLQALALAARELRTPLSGMMLSVERLKENPEYREPLAQLQRSLYQMLRVVGNMSDSQRCSASCHLQMQNVGALLDEQLEKASLSLTHTHISLDYHRFCEDIYCLVDAEQLERAVWNLLSNALKFTPAGGTVSVTVCRSDAMLLISVEDSGSGIAQQLRSSIFTRYRRTPALEDSRQGIGLGMVLVRAAAANHGGAVLIDQPGDGTRVTMTIAIRQDSAPSVHCPRFQVDYTGERDHGLVELADSLPAELYL